MRIAGTQKSISTPRLGLFLMACVTLTFFDSIAQAQALPLDQSAAPAPPPRIIVNGAEYRSIFATDCKSDSDSPALIFSTKPMSSRWILPEAPVQNIPFAGCAIDIALAKGETESASFVIHANTDLKNVRISGIKFSDARAAENIRSDLKLVKAWYQAGGAGKEIGRSLISIKANTKVLTPELLVNDPDIVRVDTKSRENYLRTNDRGADQYIDVNSTKIIERSVDHFFPDFQVYDKDTLQPVSIQKGTNQQIWIKIGSNQKIASGTYAGKIAIASDDGALNTHIPINIVVRNYELPESRLQYGIYYHGRLTSNKTPTVSSEYKTPSQLKLELSDILDHGITIPVIYQHQNDEKLFMDYLRIMKSVGFSTTNLYLVYLNTSDARTASQVQSLQNQIMKTKSIVREFDVNHLYIYGVDEAKGKDLLWQKPAWEMIHRIGEKTFAAGYEGTFEATGNLIDILIFAASPMKAEAAKYHSIGRKIFSYSNPQSGVENPYIYRKNYGLMLWAADFDGAMLYAYQHFMGEGWNDFDHAAYRDHNFTYPTANGFVGTIGWEGVREAIDDVRYVALLESKIKDVRRLNSAPALDNAKQAESYLNNIRNLMNQTNRYGEYSQDIDVDLDDIRKNIARYIDLLNEIR